MLDSLVLAVLFADSNAMPVAKKIGIIALFGVAGAVSVMGLFASPTRLEKMAGIIGTKNPVVARAVCALGAIVGWGAVALISSTFITGWDQ
jgi:hypothetical protein